MIRIINDRKISSLAGRWKMSNKEFKKLKNNLRKGWDKQSYEVK